MHVQNDIYRQVLAAVVSKNEKLIRELLQSAMSSGGPELPAEHFAVGFALGYLSADTEKCDGV